MGYLEFALAETQLCLTEIILLERSMTSIPIIPCLIRGIMICLSALPKNHSWIPWAGLCCSCFYLLFFLARTNVMCTLHQHGYLICLFFFRLLCPCSGIWQIRIDSKNVGDGPVWSLRLSVSKAISVDMGHSGKMLSLVPVIPVPPFICPPSSSRPKDASLFELVATPPSSVSITMDQSSASCSTTPTPTPTLAETSSLINPRENPKEAPKKKRQQIFVSFEMDVDDEGADGDGDDGGGKKETARSTKPKPPPIKKPSPKEPPIIDGKRLKTYVDAFAAACRTKYYW